MSANTSSAAGQRQSVEVLLGGLGRELGVATLIISLVMFISAMVVLGVYFSHSRDSYAELRRSHVVSANLSWVYAELLEREQSLRGYALSGDTDFLRWVEIADRHLRIADRNIHNLVANDPVQRTNLAKLRIMLKVRGANIAAMRDAPRERMAEQIVKLAKAHDQVPVVGLLWTMLVHERKQTELREQQILRASTIAYYMAFGIAGLALICGAVGSALTLYGRRPHP